MTDHIHEVCIIGGGPAGVATALCLQQRGIRSTIIEAATIVPHKTGETLPPAVLPILRALGADHLLNDPAHLACYGNAYCWGSSTIQEKHFLAHRGGQGWHLHRSVFESGLLGLAEQRGITILRGETLRNAVFDMAAGCWQLQLSAADGTSRVLFARFAVDATGRSSKFARCMGIKRKVLSTLVGVAARIPLPADAPVSQLTHIEAVEQGWWYAAATGNRQMITVLMTEASLLQKAQQQWPGYSTALRQTRLIASLFPAGVIAAAEPVLHTHAAGTSCLTQPVGQQWLAAGDAAYAYDPISSYGITSALGGGCYAGHAIADHLQGEADALSAYHYLVQKAFTDYLPLWQQQYAVEQRWAGTAFWRSGSSTQPQD